MNLPKTKSVPIAGVILSGLFTIDVICININGIIRACGGIIFSVYHAVTFLLVFAHAFPGLVLIPALFVIFIVQAIRFRKNHRYIKNCVYCLLGCLTVLLIGRFVSYFSPAIENTITAGKIQGYQLTVNQIHHGEQINRYTDMIGGTKGSEDVVFFQYSTGEREGDDHTFYTTEYYILYSNDPVCDVEQITKHAIGSPLYWYDALEMRKIKENWYWLEVTYQLHA